MLQPMMPPPMMTIRAVAGTVTPIAALPRYSAASTRLAVDRRLDRIRDVAEVVRLVVHRRYVVGRGPLVTAPHDVRMQDDARHRHQSGGILLEEAFGVVDIVVNAMTVLRSERQEEQHVATRDRGNERFLRIHRCRVGIRQRHRMRRRRSGYLRATVEATR